MYNQMGQKTVSDTSVSRGLPIHMNELHYHKTHCILTEIQIHRFAHYRSFDAEPKVCLYWGLRAA